MQNNIFKLFESLIGFEAARRCRRCGEAIYPSDAFGASEGVCRVCRSDGG